MTHCSVQVQGKVKVEAVRDLVVSGVKLANHWPTQCASCKQESSETMRTFFKFVTCAVALFCLSVFLFHLLHSAL